MITGFATEEATRVYADRFPELGKREYFRHVQGLWFSSIGAGSYLGNPDDETDDLYRKAFRAAVLSGINVLDTAVNYRAQRSERILGEVLRELIEEKKVSREELIVCTKGGFLPFDGAYPKEPLEYFRETYPKIFESGTLVQGCHSLDPEFLESQLSRSLKNLGLETVDIYYLHNPETQLADVKPEIFRERMKSAFVWLEEKVRQGRIRMYGTATWNGYRVRQDQADYLSLEDLNFLAREAGGTENHFKVIQLPFNVVMPEAWIFPNQRFGAGTVPPLQLAKRLGLSVMISAPLLQGKLAGPVPDFMGRFARGLESAPQRALQFVRSVPGVTSALAGMRRTEHVEENLKVAAVSPLTEEELVLMFQKA